MVERVRMFAGALALIGAIVGWSWASAAYEQTLEQAPSAAVEVPDAHCPCREAARVGGDGERAAAQPHASTASRAQ